MELFNVYSLYPIEPVRGKGCYVYDAAGTEYLDLYGGHAVISIGHAQPDYVRAVEEQVARLGFYSNSVENSLQVKLAERLGRISGYDDYRLFLCNSGAEANENALKLASFHTGRSKALAISKAFHGRTSGAVAVTDNPAISSPFNRTPNVEFTPLNDIGAMRAKLATREFAAVIVEGIQGVAGIHCPTDEFLRAVRAAATETGTQLVLDEIQSGYGRTGRFFAHQAAGIRPDLITIEEHKAVERPKVVMTWAPHPNALPQAVPNSFAEWMNAADYDFVITHPEGYELDPKFVGAARVEYDQRKALEGADFVYAKNWAAYTDPNYGKVLSRDRAWTVDAEKMALTNNARFMHCLPVRRNMIVTDEVIESPRSLVIPEAANREIAAQVVLKRLLEGLN